MKWQTRMEDPRYRLLVKQHEATLRATAAIEQRMEELNLNKAAVARLLSRSRAWISKLLHGGQNLTIFTLVEVADALDCDFEPRLVPRRSVVDVDVPGLSVAEGEISVRQTLPVSGREAGISPAQENVTPANVIPHFRTELNEPLRVANG